LCSYLALLLAHDRALELALNTVARSVPKYAVLALMERYCGRLEVRGSVRRASSTPVYDYRIV